MADTKRKSRDRSTRKVNSKKRKPTLSFTTDAGATKRRGPRLPSGIRKALDAVTSDKLGGGDSSDRDAEARIDSDDGEIYVNNDVYEYEEGVPEEESRKNRRFDPVENLEYELPEDFEDENISSEDEGNEESDDEDEENEEERHLRMLEGVTGIPGEAFSGKKNNKNTVITEAYPESEYNPSRDVLDGSGRITFDSLLAPLRTMSSFSKLKKKINEVERKVLPTQAPLHKAERERLERRAANEQSKKDLVKWEPLIKRNREAPTMVFENDVNLGFSTVGAIASEFEPRTEFEKKMAAVVSDGKVIDAHQNDGSRLLELNPVTVEDERDRQSRIAKLRSLLFRHEMKSKHMKKIKSKTYHRLLKKDRLKAESSMNLVDEEDAAKLAQKYEYERAKERMSLRHKNSSKWSKRIKERGLNAQDEGTRAAIAEKDRLHTALTRKKRSMNDSSSEESDDDDDLDYNSSGSEEGTAARLISKAKEKTLNILNQEDEVPTSGIFSLPFMDRGMKKRNEAAAEEAKLALEDLESLSNKLKGSDRAESPKSGTTSGRMVFNAAGKQAPKPSKPKAVKKTRSDNFYDDSDSENDYEDDDNENDKNNVGNNDLQNDLDVDSNLLNGLAETNQGGLLKSFDDIVKDPGPNTTHEVAIFASGNWKKVKSGRNDAVNKKSPVAEKPLSENQGLKETAKDFADEVDSDSEGEMVDGILSSGPKASYELPSQADLIHEAFAADDVEDDFEKQKQEVLNEENPEPEKPVLVPGWGQWTHIQKKRGLPSWMVKEHETAKKKREEAIKKRKDASLKHVIISEKVCKLDEKLYTKKLPYPYPSKEVFEQSIRMPIGLEFNPASTVAALNRPEVVKKSGQIIKPIEFEEVNPDEKGEIQRHGGTVQKPRKHKSKSKNKTKTKTGGSNTKTSVKV